MLQRTSVGGITGVWEVEGLCNIIQRIATHCNTLQHIAAHHYTHIPWGPLREHRRRKTSTTLQHNATNCTTMQHTATYCNTHMSRGSLREHRRWETDTPLQHTATNHTTLQHAAARCNTLQHTATHTNPEGHRESRGGGKQPSENRRERHTSVVAPVLLQRVAMH